MTSVHEKIANIDLDKRESYVKFRRGYQKYMIRIVEAAVCQGNPPNTFFVSCCHFGWCSAPPEGYEYLRDRFARFADKDEIIKACKSYVDYAERLYAENKLRWARADAQESETPDDDDADFEF